MTNIKIFIILLIYSCLSFYCVADVPGDGTQSSRDFPIASFNEIEISGSVFIEYSEGEPSLKAVGNKNALQIIEIAQTGNILKIQSQHSDSIGELTIFLSSPQIEKASLYGNGAIILKNDLSSPNFDCTINGDGSMIIRDASCKDIFSAHINGRGGIIVNSINSLHTDLAVSGGGGIIAKSIESISAGLSLNGSGGIHIKSCNADSISCELQGSGGVLVNGITTKDIDTKLIGTGNIQLSGTTSTATHFLINSGMINAADLKAKDVKASIQGEGIIDCLATGQLEGKVSGVGKIIYNGDPI